MPRDSRGAPPPDISATCRTGWFFPRSASELTLGEPDEATDEGYPTRSWPAVEGGINVVDSAINYRLQRSERSVGTALRELAGQGLSRDEIVLCTKAGFLTPDGEMPDDANEYFAREYMEPGIFRPEDIAAGCHCMTPRYLADQLDRSRRNLGVECVDVFYLHNPETQLSEVSAEEFRRRIAEAFTVSGIRRGRGKDRRLRPGDLECVPRGPEIARLSFACGDGGDRARSRRADHHFRFVQLPLNLAMPEALLRANQMVEGKTMAMVQAARALGITLVSSAALLQGQLTRNLPPYIGAALGLKKDFAERAAVCAIGTRRDHGSGRDEPGRTRSRESGGGRRRACAARSVPQTLREEELGCAPRSTVTRKAESLPSVWPDLARRGPRPLGRNLVSRGLVEPGVDGCGYLFELAREKMVRAFDDHQLLRLGECREKSFKTWARAELVVAALDDELWLGAGAQETHVDIVDRQPQANHTVHALVSAAHSNPTHDPKLNPARRTGRPGNSLAR